MPVGSQETCPLPEHPDLAAVADALNRIGAWGVVLDREYHLVYMTDDARLTNGAFAEMVPVPLGGYFFGPEYIDAMLDWPGAGWSADTMRDTFYAMGPWALADAPGGREELRELVDPRLRDIVEGLAPAEQPSALTFAISGAALGGTAPFDFRILVERIRDAEGRFVGVMHLGMTAVGMSTIGALATIGDLGHFERMQRVAKAGRRPAGILFADLEGSSALARHLSTASYFTLGRRLARAADQCVIDAGGLVGRHVGRIASRPLFECSLATRGAARGE